MFFHIGNPPATGTGTLHITLEDVNDNVPSLYPTLAKVCDDAKDLRVVVLGASDKDLHPNTDPFKFELSKQSGPEKLWRITKLNSKSVTFLLMHLVLPPIHPSLLALRSSCVWKSCRTDPLLLLYAVLFVLGPAAGWDILIVCLHFC